MIWIILPAYNEELTIPILFRELAEAFADHSDSYEIIICDDGSNDGTVDAIRKESDDHPVTLIQHKVNRGLGETIRDLMEAAAERAAPDDIIVRMDCDCTHEPQYISSLVAAIRGGSDIALASRFEAGGGQVGVVGQRKLLSSAANIFMRLVFPIKGVREYSCGFRAYRAALIQHAIAHYGGNFIQLHSLGFAVTLEKLVKLNLLRPRISEVPFCLRYDRKQSETKMVFSLTTLGYFILAILYHWPWGGWRTSANTHPFNETPRDDG